MSDFDIGSMVIISPKSYSVARGQPGWVSGFTGTRTNVFLKCNNKTVTVLSKYLLDAEKGFVWPRGTQAQLRIYSESHPQLIPTEAYFSKRVQKNIIDARKGLDYVNLWLLIDSLKNLNNPDVSAGFHTWLWAIEGVLGEEGCRNIGKTVCSLMGFTLDEAEQIWNGPYRIKTANELKLPESASWEDIKNKQKRKK